MNFSSRHELTWRERIARWVCRTFGHRWVGDLGGSKAMPAFDTCQRCGSWRRQAVVKALREEGKRKSGEHKQVAP